VTNLNDAGMGSLRQAISDTPSGGTVDFQPGLSGTITLATGELAIDKDLTIAGPGASVITVSGNHASRVFDITGTFTVFLSGLTIADGSVSGDTAAGGGILNDGRLTITDSTINGNSAGSTGGGISGGTLTVTGCTLSDNSAAFFGGGIEGGTITVTGSALSGNTADGGGGIYSFGGTITVTGCTLSRNSGNAIFLEEGGHLTVTDSTISDNTFIEASGGGINSEGDLTVTRSTISGNSATYLGGGIYIAGIANATITDSIISGNTAISGSLNPYGGGIYNSGVLTLTGSTLSGNTADRGGGLYNNTGTAIVSDCTITRNSAIDGEAGGIDNVGSMTVTGSILSGNSSTESGGGIASFGPLMVTDCTLGGNSAASGGGIYNSSLYGPPVLTIADSILSGNTASGAGSGIYNEGILAVRGLVTIDGDYFQTANGTLDLRIGGTQAGTDYDQLVVNGLATLDGTLRINLVNGYQPQHRDRFHPLLWGSVSGTFAAYTGDASEFLIVYVYAPGYEDSGWPVGLTLVAH
jgi:hypothetical protein